MDIQAGMLGSLTLDQEARLQQLWMFLLNAFENHEIFDKNYSMSGFSRRSTSLDEPPPMSPASFDTTYSHSRSMSSTSNNYNGNSNNNSFNNNNILPLSPNSPISPGFSPTAPRMSSELRPLIPQHQPSVKKLRRRTSLVMMDYNKRSNSLSFSQPNTPTIIPRRTSIIRRGSLTFQPQSMGGVNLRPSPQNAKVMQRIMANYGLSSDELRQGLLVSLKQDHPDAMLLRFLRACKWDVGKAFAMLVGAVAWRMKKMHIDDDILPRGELYALKQSRSSKMIEARRGMEFMRQLRLGKHIIHGVDRAGRPIIDIRVRLHRADDQFNDVLEKYIVHTIESVRMLLRPPLVETAVLIFDLTDFTMANMDYSPVRYFIKCAENFYPESIARVIIHKAPWFFSGIWKMIKTWMNDSLVSKIYFTKTFEDLERFIPRQNIPQDLGGTDDRYQYHYIEPDLDDRAENLPLDVHSPTRDFLLGQRQRIAEEFLDTTRQWLQAIATHDRIGTAIQESRRSELIEELRLNFWKVDPFVRARCQLDREGIIVSDGIGTIDFYPHLRPVSMSSFDSVTPAAVTSSPTPGEKADAGVGLGLLSPMSSRLDTSSTTDEDKDEDEDEEMGEYRNGGAATAATVAGSKEQAVDVDGDTTPTSPMNGGNFLLDESDNNSHDEEDDSDARDDIMQEYMDDEGDDKRNSMSYKNDSNTTVGQEKEKENGDSHLQSQSNNHKPDESDEMDDDDDDDDDNNYYEGEEEEIEIHDAVTQKIPYPVGGGFVERAAVRVVNVR